MLHRAEVLRIPTWKDGEVQRAQLRGCGLVDGFRHEVRDANLLKGSLAAPAEGAAPQRLGRSRDELATFFIDERAWSWVLDEDHVPWFCEGAARCNVFQPETIDATCALWNAPQNFGFTDEFQFCYCFRGEITFGNAGAAEFLQYPSASVGRGLPR